MPTSSVCLLRLSSLWSSLIFDAGAFLHPNDVSCLNVATGFAANEFKGAVKFFSAISILSALVRYKKSMKKSVLAALLVVWYAHPYYDSPETTLYRMALSTLTSSAFLSLSIGTAWSTICLFQKLLPGSFLPTKRFYLQVSLLFLQLVRRSDFVMMRRDSWPDSGLA